MWPPPPSTPLFPDELLHPRALAAMHASGDTVWCVAVSGGADSVALLLTAYVLARRLGRRVVTLHFDHRLRAASGGDATFVSELSAHLGCAVVQETWADAPAAASEADAREARNAFFHRALRQSGSTTLWTGHHLDDVVETQLMRLARGSGTGGLSAPRPVQAWDAHVRLRPLLNLRKRHIVEALVQHGWTWREDETNAGNDYVRNRIRHDVVPQWEEANARDAMAGAALSRERLEEDDDALTAWLERICPAMEWGSDTLDLRGLAGLPIALWRRALHRWPYARGLSREGFDQLLAVAQRGGVANLTIGTAVAEAGVIRFQSASEKTPAQFGELPVPLDGEACLPNGATLAAKTLHVTPELLADFGEGAINPSFEAYVAGPVHRLQARSVLPGDRYRPLGLKGSKKVQDLFVDGKIPLESRNQIPMIIDERGEIVWIPGFAPSETRRISSETPLGVRLTYCTGKSNFFTKSQKKLNGR